MPLYEYVCMACGTLTEVRAILSEKEKGLKVVCRKCGGKNLAQVFGNVIVMGKSRSNSAGPCGPQGGSCCCR